MSAFEQTMDIRGIAWAGYFFSPPTASGIGPDPIEYLCVDPPDISADELVPIITSADADCPC